MSAKAPRRRPGRPPGNSDTRERILASARELFAANGIDKTSIRAVAAAAGVDPALVHHYFGTKQRLFTAAIHIPIDPMAVLGPIRDTPVDELGHRLPALVIPLWDEFAPSLVATVRSIIGGSEVTLIRSFLREVIVTQLGARLDNPPGTGVIRAELAVTQMLGVMMARYILELEPFASLPPDKIAATIAPNLQRYMTGDLPELST